MLAKQKNTLWRQLSFLLAIGLMIPVIIMLFAGINASSELFLHLWQTVLPHYLTNTLLLAVFVVVLSVFFGVTSAALIAYTNIYSKAVLRWLLLLPLAMPAYVVAYLYTDLFDYAGPVQRLLRQWFSWQSPADYWFFDIRSLGGASVVIAFVLFPYVYMLARNAFEQQDQNLLRASQSLGLSVKQSFYQVALPLARPAVAVAASLVLMETLADFATVQYFSVNTLTTAIYDTWLGYSDFSTANALASILMLVILFVVISEQRARAKNSQQSPRPNNTIQLIILRPYQQLLAVSFCWLLAFIGFLLPFYLLMMMAIDYATIEQLFTLLPIGLNSVQIACWAATLATLLALCLGLYKRLSSDVFKALPIQIASFGYAIPGTVLAMAMLATFAPIDHMLNDIAKYVSMKEPGLILSGSIFAVIFAYVVRFAAIANGTVDSGIVQIPSSVDLAPPSLGVGLTKTLFTIHLPLLKPSILIAWLLVFVEAMKELPAVLVLRPFNFETLSTQVYSLISDEMLEQGALGAILIVLLGLLPIIWLNKSQSN